MTNYDKIIKEMTVERLATEKAISSYCHGKFYKCIELRNKYKGSTACYYCWLDYLRQEADE
jgi:hypothetical protein